MHTSEEKVTVAYNSACLGSVYYKYCPILKTEFCLFLWGIFFNDIIWMLVFLLAAGVPWINKRRFFCSEYVCVNHISSKSNYIQNAAEDLNVSTILWEVNCKTALDKLEGRQQI